MVPIFRIINVSCFGAFSACGFRLSWSAVRDALHMVLRSYFELIIIINYIALLMGWQRLFCAWFSSRNHPPPLCPPPALYRTANKFISVGSIRMRDAQPVTIFFVVLAWHYAPHDFVRSTILKWTAIWLQSKPWDRSPKSIYISACFFAPLS